MRFGAGFESGMLEAFVGPFWSAYQLSGEGVGSLFGAGGKLLFQPPLTDRLRFVLGAGLDAYVNRVQVEIGGEPAFATPRFGWTASAGVGWQL